MFVDNTGKIENELRILIELCKVLEGVSGNFPNQEENLKRALGIRHEALSEGIKNCNTENVTLENMLGRLLISLNMEKITPALYTETKYVLNAIKRSVVNF